MPASSPTMLFTWSAESILVGLVAYAVCEPNYLIYAQLALACLTCVLHVAALAAASDSHHSISVSYLCVVTAMLVQDRTGPLESLNSMVTMCAFVVAEVVALGMTFASCEGATALFLHSRGWVRVRSVLEPVHRRGGSAFYYRGTVRAIRERRPCMQHWGRGRIHGLELLGGKLVSGRGWRRCVSCVGRVASWRVVGPAARAGVAGGCFAIRPATHEQAAVLDGLAQDAPAALQGRSVSS